MGKIKNGLLVTIGITLSLCGWVFVIWAAIKLLQYIGAL